MRTKKQAVIALLCLLICLGLVLCGCTTEDVTLSDGNIMDKVEEALYECTDMAPYIMEVYNEANYILTMDEEMAPQYANDVYEALQENTNMVSCNEAAFLFVCLTGREYTNSQLRQEVVEYSRKTITYIQMYTDIRMDNVPLWAFVNDAETIAIHQNGEFSDNADLISQFFKKLIESGHAWWGLV